MSFNSPIVALGDVLVESITVAPGGTTNIAFDNLTDVDLTTVPPVSGDSIEYDGTNWVPVSGGGGATDADGNSQIVDGANGANVVNLANTNNSNHLYINKATGFTIQSGTEPHAGLSAAPPVSGAIPASPHHTSFVTRVTTVGATSTPIAIFPSVAGNENSYKIEIECLGVNSAGGTVFYKKINSIHSNGAAPLIIKKCTNGSIPGGNIDIITTAAGFQAEVTGIAANTIVWDCTVIYTQHRTG